MLVSSLCLKTSTSSRFLSPEEIKSNVLCCSETFPLNLKGLFAIHPQTSSPPVIPSSSVCVLHLTVSSSPRTHNLTLNRPGGGGGGIRPQAGSSFCCAETVSSRKLKLCDFYYILIGLNSEYKPVPMLPW